MIRIINYEAGVINCFYWDFARACSAFVFVREFWQVKIDFAYN